MSIEEMLRTIVREELEAWQPAAAQEWLTVPEAAEHARVSESTMYGRIRDGIVPSHRFESRILVSRTELDEAIRAMPPALARSQAVA